VLFQTRPSDVVDRMRRQEMTLHDNQGIDGKETLIRPGIDGIGKTTSGNGPNGGKRTGPHYVTLSCDPTSCPTQVPWSQGSAMRRTGNAVAWTYGT
jgi:hypothetical protein